MTKRTGISIFGLLLLAAVSYGCVDEPGFVSEERSGITFSVSTAQWQGGVFAETKSPRDLGEEGIPVSLTDITDPSGEVIYMMEAMEGVPVETSRTLGSRADASTKAVEKTSWADGEQFGVRAYATGSDYSSEFDYFGESKLATYDEANTSWDLPGTLYWPTSRNLIKFYAWWPYSGAGAPEYDAADKLLTYEVPTDPLQQTDLLYAATNQLNVIGQQGVVPLEFKHALTAVVFKGADAELNISIKSITLKNVWCKGEFNLDAQSWMIDKTHTEDMKDITFDAYHSYRGDLDAANNGWYYSNDNGASWDLETDPTERKTPVLNDNGNLLMLIPQDMVDADGSTKRRVVFTLMDDSTIEVDLPQTPAWTPGSTVVYTLQKGGKLWNCVTTHSGEYHYNKDINVVATNSFEYWRYKNMPPDGTHPTSWFTKVRGKFKVKYYKLRGPVGGYGPEITPTNAEVPLEDTYGFKIFVPSGTTYEEAPNVWYHTFDDAQTTGTYGYSIRVGIPAPFVETRYSTKEVIDEALRAATPLGSSTDHYDLSSTATANCYILEAPGYYKFKAVKGNDAANAAGLDLTGADISYIADNPNIIDGDCTIDAGYIKFKTKESDLEQGNIIITASNGGTTLWQWHIWVTSSANWHPAGESTIHSKVGSTTTNYTFHPVSLGLCYTGWHVTYNQRKECYVRLVGIDDDGSELTGRWHVETGFYLRLLPDPIEEGYYYATYRWGDAVPSALKGFPGSSYYSYSTPLFPVPAFSNTNPVEHTLATTTWNGSATTDGPYAATYGVTKTIYDPSPAGWHVPPPQATNNISTDGSIIGNVHGYAENTIGTSIVDLKVLNKHQDGSAISPGITFWSKSGWYYWSGGTNESGTISNAYGSYQTGSSTWGPAAVGVGTQGLVRPVKD